MRTEINIDGISPLVSSRLEPRSLKRQRFSLLKLGNSASVQTEATSYPIDMFNKGKCKPDDPVELRHEKVLEKM